MSVMACSIDKSSCPRALVGVTCAKNLSYSLQFCERGLGSSSAS
jgi:hypothetical protein